jgi:hypothetical protein
MMLWLTLADWLVSDIASRILFCCFPNLYRTITETTAITNILTQSFPIAILHIASQIDMVARYTIAGRQIGSHVVRPPKKIFHKKLSPSRASN